MFFGPGDPDCIDCTTLNGEWVCTMNCGPKCGMPQGAGEESDPMTRQIDGGQVAGQDPHERAGTAGVIVRPATTPREVRAGAVCPECGGTGLRMEAKRD